MDAETSLTDLHFLVLALFARETINSADDVAEVLGIPRSAVPPLLAELVEAGMIEAETLH